MYVCFARGGKGIPSVLGSREWMGGVHELWLRTLSGRNSELGLPTTRNNRSLRWELAETTAPWTPTNKRRPRQHSTGCHEQATGPGKLMTCIHHSRMALHQWFLFVRLLDVNSIGRFYKESTLRKQMNDKKHGNGIT